MFPVLASSLELPPPLPPGAVTVRVTVATAVVDPSVPVIVKDEGPNAEPELPVITPVDVLNVKPEGREGEMEYVTVPVNPDAVSAELDNEVPVLPDSV